MAIAGLDIGTTGCKIIIYNNEGKLLYQAYRTYLVSRSASTHEIDASLIWQATMEVINESAKNVKDIQAIGITTFGESFVMLDDNDNILYPSILYTDPRGENECNVLIKKLGKDVISNITGVNAHLMYSIPKLMWIKKNEPEIFAKTKRVLLMQDFIVYMLTGLAQMDYSLATRTLGFDINELCWSSQILEAARIDEALLSKLVPSGTKARSIKESLAVKLRLNKDTQIVTCCHDQVAAATGAGVFESGCAVDGAGTVECITPVFDTLPDTKLMQQGSYPIAPHCVSGKYVCYAFTFTGGALVKWFVDNLAGYEKVKAKEQGISVYKVLENGMKDEPTGILVLPHFAGAATPYMDAGSKGAFVGLNLVNTAPDMFKAIMEGIAYEMKLNMDNLKKAGININALYATGGGAKSKVWMQIKADILNVPIVSLGTGEAGVVGSVMLTGVAIGNFDSLESAKEVMINQEDTFYPEEDMHKKYMKYYDKYKDLYKSVRPLV